VVSLSELICIHYFCIAAMLIQFLRYIYYFEGEIVINVVDALSVFDIATTLRTLCCRSVGSDQSHLPLSASFPTATRSFHQPPPLNFLEFRESATTASAEDFISTSLPSIVVSLSELICIHYICIAAMLIPFLRYISYFEGEIVINVVDALSVTLVIISLQLCAHCVVVL